MVFEVVQSSGKILPRYASERWSWSNGDKVSCRNDNIWTLAWVYVVKQKRSNIEIYRKV